MTMSTLLWILGIVVFFYIMRRSGGGCCGGHNHNDKIGDENQGGHPSDPEIDNGQNHQSSAIKLAIMEPEKDPVCSMEVGNHSIGRNHLGRTFYFCSDKCRKIFDLNPNKYIQI